MANSTFKFIIQGREAFIRLIDTLSVEELNRIPEGFNNNIIWNFGHIVVTTPALCYVRSGLWENASSIKFLEDFQKGSKPSRQISESEIEELKALAISSIKAIEQDDEKGVFSAVKPFSTSTYGAEMVNFDEILITTSGHDNMHLGYALAQKRLIKQ